MSATEDHCSSAQPKAPMDALLLLSACASADNAVDPTALHLYRGLDRLSGSPEVLGSAFHQLWTCAEELQLLFNANAIWIRGLSAAVRHRDSGGITEVASLTGAEKDLLRSSLWEGGLPADATVAQQSGITFVRLQRPLGEEIAALHNSNLRSTTSWLKCHVNRPGEVWEMALLLPRGGKAGEGITANLAAWLMAEPGRHAEAFLQALGDINLSFGMPEADRQDFWRFNRPKLLKGQKDLDVRGLVTRYSKQIEAMQPVLNRLYKGFNDLVKSTLRYAAVQPSIIFSYRHPNEDAIYFLPTLDQTEQFVREEGDIEPFLKFCSFGYKREKALSGWVLSTGMSDYTENFTEDKRWTSWVESGEEEGIQEQLDRVQRYLQKGKEKLLPHVYLVPIVTAKSTTGDGLETILMASISVPSPLPVETRQKILNLAIRMRPTVEVALDAQKNSSLRPDGTTKTRAEVIRDWLTTANGATALIAGLATVVGIVLGISHWAQTSTPPGKIKFGVNPIPMSAMTILADKGNYFGRYNLEAKSVKFSTGKAALDALLSGDAQFATVAETPLVLAALADQKIAVVATMAESNKEMGLVVNTDKIKSLKDLQGATLATKRNTNADYFMDAFLRNNNIPAGKVKIIDLDPGAMPAAFAKGSIDGYFMWQPFLLNGSRSPGMHTAVYGGSSFYTMTFNIVTSRDYAAKHGKEVQEFLHALKDAEEEIARDPSEAQDAVAEASGIDHDAVATVWPNYRFGLKLDDSLPGYMRDQLPYAMRATGSHAGTAPDFRSMLAPDALRTIKPGGVTLH